MSNVTGPPPYNKLPPNFLHDSRKSCEVLADMNATCINMKACYPEQDNRFPGSVLVLLSPCTLHPTGNCVPCPIINSGHLPATMTTITTTGTTVAGATTTTTTNTTNNSTTPIVAATTSNSWNTPVRVLVD